MVVLRSPKPLMRVRFLSLLPKSYNKVDTIRNDIISFFIIFNCFYRSAEWQIARAEKIASINGRCEKCVGIGEEVHHSIELTLEKIENPETILRKNNLIFLCKYCHNAHSTPKVQEKRASIR